MKKKYLYFLITIVTILFFLFPRFYNLNNRLSFDWDQERDAFQISKQIETRQPALIGPRVVGPTGFYLGPYYLYALTPFYLISNLHPQGSLYFIYAINIAFAFFSFFIIKKIFSPKIAILFLFFWGFNPLIISYETNAWNPILIPIGILSLWQILSMVYKSPNRILNWIFLGLNLGVFINIHFQYVFLIIFSASFVTFSQKKILLNFKKIFVSLSAFISTFIPLIVFDLRHNFLNTNLFINFFFPKASSKFFINTDMFNPVWGNIFPFLNYVKYGILLVIILYLFFLGLFVKLKNLSQGFKYAFFKSALFLWLVFPIVFFLWKKMPSDYYYFFVYPFLWIAISTTLVKLNNKLTTICFILVFFLFNINSILNKLQSPSTNLKNKDLAILKIKEIAKNKPLNVSFSVPLGRDTGYRYLIKYYKLNISGKWLEDPLVQIVIPPQKNNIIFGGIGVDVPQKLY